MCKLAFVVNISALQGTLGHIWTGLLDLKAGRSGPKWQLNGFGGYIYTHHEHAEAFGSGKSARVVYRYALRRRNYGTMRVYDQWKFAMIRIPCSPCAFMETAGLSCAQFNVNYYHVFDWVARGIREDGLSENVRLYIIIAYTYLDAGTAHSRPDPCSRGSLTDGNCFRRNIEKVTYRWRQIAENIVFRISG